MSRTPGRSLFDGQTLKLSNEMGESMGRDQVFRAGVVALLVNVVAGLHSASAGAAEIKVLCTRALTDAMAEIGPKFERKTGHKLALSFGTSASIERQVDAGEPSDVLVLTGPGIERLMSEGMVVAGTRADVAATEVALAMKAGAARPDISTTDAFKQTLLDARMIAYAPPESGSASGIQFSRVIERLGISEAIKPRVTLVRPPRWSGELVANGEAEIAVQMSSEFHTIKGVEIVGPLPPEFRSKTVFSTGIAKPVQDHDAAKAFTAFLTSSEAADVIHSKGLEPQTGQLLSQR